MKHNENTSISASGWVISSYATSADLDDLESKQFEYCHNLSSQNQHPVHQRHLNEEGASDFVISTNQARKTKSPKLPNLHSVLGKDDLVKDNSREYSLPSRRSPQGAESAHGDMNGSGCYGSSLSTEYRRATQQGNNLANHQVNKQIHKQISQRSAAYAKSTSHTPLTAQRPQSAFSANRAFNTSRASDALGNELTKRDVLKADTGVASNAKQPFKSKEARAMRLSSQSSGQPANQHIINESYPQLPERLFMSTLVKHTLIALAIIVPLAAVTAYAATPNFPIKPTSSTDPVVPSASIIASQDASHHNHNILTASESTHGKPAAVDRVDLSRYSGVWYEIGRLPMYFQRKCASDVTATYTPQANSNAITVLNQCRTDTGNQINASGQAVPVDGSGSKLKVSFLPSWLRWAPIGKADYWVLALEDNYQSALVGTPNKKYLWVLSRSPNLSEQTYQRYRQIAQNQGYDLSEFKLTQHSKSS